MKTALFLSILISANIGMTQTQDKSKSGGGVHGGRISEDATPLFNFPGEALFKKKVGQLRNFDKAKGDSLADALLSCKPMRLKGSPNPFELDAAIAILPTGACRIYYFDLFFEKNLSEVEQARITTHEALHYATRLDRRYLEGIIDDRLGIRVGDSDIQAMAHILIYEDLNSEGTIHHFEGYAYAWNFALPRSASQPIAGPPNLYQLWEHSRNPNEEDLKLNAVWSCVSNYTNRDTEIYQIYFKKGSPGTFVGFIKNMNWWNVWGTFIGSPNGLVNDYRRGWIEFHSASSVGTGKGYVYFKVTEDGSLIGKENEYHELKSTSEEYRGSFYCSDPTEQN